jgi:hypothetical protein
MHAWHHVIEKSSGRRKSGSDLPFHLELCQVSLSQGRKLRLLGPMIPDGLERIFPHDGMREEADCG